MPFALFLLLNAVLFIRPEEIWPDLNGLRLYLIVICLCLMASGGRVLYLLSPDSLRQRPLDVCVLGYWFAAGLSLVLRADLSIAMDMWGEFGKVVVLYFLCVAVLDTPERFRTYLGWLVVFAGTMSGLAVLNYTGQIELPVFDIIVMPYTDADGTLTEVSRLCGLGVFRDPNDMCLLVVIGGMGCLARWVSGGSWLWLVPLALFGYTMVLTQSRGGLLTVLASLAGATLMRFGWRRAMPLALVCGPALVLAMGGRQADINIGSGDTGNERVKLWAMGISFLLSKPFWVPNGIGAYTYGDEFGQVAHNSFVHAYVELGLLGGTFFLAAFAYPLLRWYRTKREEYAAPDWFVVMRPCMFGLMAGYAMGMFSLSRNYVVPTFLVLGLARAYTELAIPAGPQDQVNARWWVRLAFHGVLGFAALKYITQALTLMGI